MNDKRMSLVTAVLEENHMLVTHHHKNRETTVEMVLGYNKEVFNRIRKIIRNLSSEDAESLGIKMWDSKDNESCIDTLDLYERVFGRDGLLEMAAVEEKKKE